MSVCVTEIEIKCRDNVERLGVLALRAAAVVEVCGNAVLSFSHRVAQFSLNIPPTPLIVSEEVKLCQQLFGMMLVC